MVRLGDGSARVYLTCTPRALFVRIVLVSSSKGFDNITSGGPNNSLIKSIFLSTYSPAIVNPQFVSNRQSYRLSFVFRTGGASSYWRPAGGVASRARQNVDSAWSPSRSLVGDTDTWSRESGQGTHAGRGRRGGRPSPAGNTRVFSLTLAAPVFRDIAENPTNREKTIYNSTTDTPNIHISPLTTDGGNSSQTPST